MDTRDIGKIEYALIHGNYKTRKLAAEALEIVGDDSSIPLLLDAMNDKVQIVSIAALNALETLNFCDNVIASSIIKKRFDWVRHIRESNERFESNKDKKYNIYKWERTTKKNFEMVKERLKRPIR